MRFLGYTLADPSTPIPVPCLLVLPAAHTRR